MKNLPSYHDDKYPYIKSSQISGGVMDKTPDVCASDPGSNPGGIFFFYCV